LALPQDFDVVPNDRGEWDVRARGATKPLASHRAQRDAAYDARARARQAGGGEVRIHRRDGKVRRTHIVP
jgi:hypothetical protein